MSGLFFLLTAILLGACGQLLLKQGMASHPGFHLRDVGALARSPAVVGGFGCYGLSVLLYFKALADLPLSFAYPTVALGYVLVILASRWRFGERVSAARWAAVAIICAGVALVGAAAAAQ